MSYDYLALRRVITNTLNRPDAASNIDDWIYLFEQDVNLVLRRREMTQLATSATVSSQAAYALPTDYGEAIALHLNGVPLEALDPSDWNSQIQLHQDFPARPQRWSITQDEFLLAPIPDAVYTLELYYYKTIANLTASAPTNWLLTSYPQMYLFGALAVGALTLIDEPRAKTWVQAYQASLQKLLHDEVRAQGVGGGPVLRVEVPFGGGHRQNILTGA